MWTTTRRRGRSLQTKFPDQEKQPQRRLSPPDPGPGICRQPERADMHCFELMPICSLSTPLERSILRLLRLPPDAERDCIQSPGGPLHSYLIEADRAAAQLCRSSLRLLCRSLSSVGPSHTALFRSRSGCLAGAFFAMLQKAASTFFNLTLQLSSCSETFRARGVVFWEFATIQKGCVPWKAAYSWCFIMTGFLLLQLFLLNKRGVFSNLSEIFCFRA